MAQAGFTPIQLYFSTTAAAVPLAANLAQGELAINITDGKLYYENNSGTVTLLASAAGASGDVVGPASATDNAVARFDGTTGKLIQNGVVIIGDTGAVTGVTDLTTTGNTILGDASTDTLNVGNGGLIKDASGNLGLGVTPSAWASFRALDLQYNGALASFSSGAVALVYNAFFNGGSWIAKSTGSSSKFGLDSNGSYSWQQASSVTGGSAFTYSTAMTLDASGNLGVGTTSPTNIANYKTVTVNGTTGGLIDVASNGTIGARIQCDTTYPGMALFTLTNNPMVFGTNGSERARIDSSGNMGLNVTPSSWGAGTRAFQIGSGTSLWNPGSSTNTLLLTNAYNDGTNYIYRSSSTASYYAQSGAQHQWFNAPSGTAGNAITFTQAMTLDADGDLIVGGTSTTAKLAVANNTNDGTSNTRQYAVFGTTTTYLDSDAANLWGSGLGEFQIQNGTATRPAMLSMGGSVNTDEGMGVINFFRSGNDDTFRSRVQIAGVVGSTGTAGRHGGYLEIRIAADGQTGPATNVRFNPSGTVILKGGTTSADGTGITFPATQSASTNANTLDDYEEGTWTPVIIGDSGQAGQVYATQTGAYTKIGRQVTLRFELSFSTEGTFTGSYLLISGFPFVSAASPSTVSAGQFYFANMATNYITIGAQIYETTNSAYLWAITTAATSRTYVGTTDLTNSSQFTGTIIYFV